MKFLIAFICAAVLALFADDVSAQTTPNTPPFSILGGAVGGISVTTTTSRTALPANLAYGALTINNYGAKDVYFALGGTSVVATTSSTPLRAGKHITIWVGANVDIAAICGGSDSSTLDIYQATGPVNLGP